MGKSRVKQPRGGHVVLSPQVKAKLEEMKARNGHQTMDSVLRSILAKAGESV